MLQPSPAHKITSYGTIRLWISNHSNNRHSYNNLTVFIHKGIIFQIWCNSFLWVLHYWSLYGCISHLTASWHVREWRIHPLDIQKRYVGTRCLMKTVKQGKLQKHWVANLVFWSWMMYIIVWKVKWWHSIK